MKYSTLKDLAATSITTFITSSKDVNPKVVIGALFRHYAVLKAASEKTSKSFLEVAVEKATFKKHFITLVAVMNRDKNSGISKENPYLDLLGEVILGPMALKFLNNNLSLEKFLLDVRNILASDEVKKQLMDVGYQADTLAVLDTVLEQLYDYLVYWAAEHDEESLEMFWELLKWLGFFDKKLSKEKVKEKILSKFKGYLS